MDGCSTASNSRSRGRKKSDARSSSPKQNEIKIIMLSSSSDEEEAKDEVKPDWREAAGFPDISVVAMDNDRVPRRPKLAKHNSMPTSFQSNFLCPKPKSMAEMFKFESKVSPKK